MIKDYKGEMPKNVTTPEKAKAKKPFYKDWKFWVLTGLMTLFGACSVYGLVLGSQYVKAIERASHIIADANSVGSKNESLRKNRENLVGASSVVAYLDLGDLGWTKTNGSAPANIYFYSDVVEGIIQTANTTTASIACGAFPTVPHNNNYNRPSGAPLGISVSGKRICVADLAFDNFSASEFRTAVDGIGCYYRTNEDYNGQSAEEYFTSEGYNDGYQEGYGEGYSDGYSDGSDAINVNQSVKVLLPAGEENACSVATYLDGVLDQQITLSSSSSFGAYGEFARDRNKTLRIDLTLPTGYRAFFMYVPNWTSAYPSDENYSLRQSWAVSGVTYLPTWVSKPEIYVDITSALVEDLTYNTISVAFDVDHWGDVRVGAYQQGYQDGYVDGQQNPTAYQSGYDSGYADGHAQGETEGFNRGVAVGSSGSQSLAMMFKTAFQLPFDQLYRFLNFNLLGINFLSLFTALISVSIGIMVIKKVL